jgi:hypothetical protein
MDSLAGDDGPREHFFVKCSCPSCGSCRARYTDRRDRCTSASKTPQICPSHLILMTAPTSDTSSSPGSSFRPVKRFKFESIRHLRSARFGNSKKNLTANLIDGRAKKQPIKVFVTNEKYFVSTKVRVTGCDRLESGALIGSSVCQVRYQVLFELSNRADRRCPLYYV